MVKSSIDQNGFRRQEANPVSMVGVFPYLGSQIDYDGALGLEPKKIYWVFRSPDQLFSEDALKSFNGLPILIGHTMLGKGFESVDKRPADGCIYNARQSLDMPEYLIAEFCIYTDRMKEVIEAGKIRELSLGYRCQYVPCVGSYKGKPYEFKQVNLRGNHLALVEHGRCGSSVRVCDQALITFDSLPEEMLGMTEEKKNTGIENARKLAEAVANGDEQACQDCLDFYDLTPEQRKEALAFVKGKKEKSEAPVEDKSAEPKKDTKDEVPPPPPPPEKKDDEEKKEETPAAGEEKPVEGAEAAPVETAVAEVVEEGKDGEAATAVVETATEEKPVEEKPATEDCGDKGGCKDETATVTEPSIPTPKTALEGAVVPKKDDEKKEEAKPATEDSCKEAKCDENADGNCDNCGKPEEKGEVVEQKEESHVEKPKAAAEDEVAKEETAAAPVEEEKVEAKEEAKAEAEEKPAEEVKEEAKEEVKEEAKVEDKKDCSGKACISEDEYKVFATEYANAQRLASAVRPYIKETFDSALMREIDVARFAVQHIESLAFAEDEADDVVLGVVRGHVAKIKADEEEAKGKVYVMDEQIPETAKVETAAPVNTKQELADFLG